MKKACELGLHWTQRIYFFKKITKSKQESDNKEEWQEKQDEKEKTYLQCKQILCGLFVQALPSGLKEQYLLSASVSSLVYCFLKL